MICPVADTLLYYRFLLPVKKKVYKKYHMFLECIHINKSRLYLWLLKNKVNQKKSVTAIKTATLNKL